MNFGADDADLIFILLFFIRKIQAGVIPRQRGAV
jgi:hypothetical protein